MCFGGVSALFVDIRKRLLGGPSHMAAGLVRVAPFPILLHAYDMKGSEGWPDPWIAHPEWGKPSSSWPLASDQSSSVIVDIRWGGQGGGDLMNQQMEDISLSHTDTFN